MFHDYFSQSAFQYRILFMEKVSIMVHVYENSTIRAKNISLQQRCFSLCVFLGSKVRLATLEMSMVLMKQLVYNQKDKSCYLQDRHLAAIEGAREEGALLLRNFYKVWEKVHVRTFCLF